MVEKAQVILSWDAEELSQQTRSLHTQVRRLPPGLSSQANLRNGRKEQRQMTEMATYSGAFSDAQVPWSTLKWNSVSRNVRRLQARLVKATQAKRWGKVTALQRLLTRSCSAKGRAIRRVTDNTGKNTPGADGEVWHTPEKQSQALNELKHQG